MSYRALSLICATLCAAYVAGQVELPPTVKFCKKDSDDYLSCLRLAIQEAWPTFMQGIPELEVPILDPYFTDSHEGSYENGEVRGKILAKNVQTYGLSKAKFLSVKAKHSDNYFLLEIDLEMPKLFLEGEYKAEGALGSFKMGGKGNFNISMEDVTATWVIEGPVKDDRWIVEHFRVTPEIGSMKVWFSDLFNGNEELNRAALAFVNEYWPVLYRGMLPYMMEMWDVHLTEFVNRIFSKVSFSKTFP